MGGEENKGRRLTLTYKGGQGRGGKGSFVYNVMDYSVVWPDRCLIEPRPLGRSNQPCSSIKHEAPISHGRALSTKPIASIASARFQTSKLRGGRQEGSFVHAISRLHFGFVHAKSYIYWELLFSKEYCLLWKLELMLRCTYVILACWTNGIITAL